MNQWVELIGGMLLSAALTFVLGCVFYLIGWIDDQRHTFKELINEFKKSELRPGEACSRGARPDDRVESRT